jgi:PAS fold
VEYRIHRPDGSVRWIRDRSFPLKDLSGQVYRLTGVADDVTDTKRAEEKLKRQNERLCLLNEAAGHLLAASDPHAMVKGLFERVRDHLGVDAYFNFMVSEAGDTLLLVSSAGISEKTAQSINRLEFGQAICGTAALERRPFCATYIRLYRE